MDLSLSSEILPAEVHLIAVSNLHDDFIKFKADWDEPLCCYAAAGNVELAISGDSHSVFVQGNNINIHVNGDNIRLGVDGQNVTVTVNGRGTILYTDSGITFEGPNQIAHRYALNAPDCPEVLPFQMERVDTQQLEGVTGRSWFLDMIYDRQARSSNDDNPGNGVDEDDENGEEYTEDNPPDDDEEDAPENLPDDDENDSAGDLPDIVE